MEKELLYYLFGVFRKYHKTCSSSLIMLIIGVIIYVIDYTNLSISFLSVPIKWHIKAFPFIISIILYVFAIIVFFYKSYPRKNELNFESIKLKWYVLNEQGDFSSSIIYSVKNRSKAPITEIRGEREGFSCQKNDSLPVRYSLFGPSRNRCPISISFRLPPTPFIREIDTLGNKTTVHTWEWCINLSPGLMPKEEIQIIRRLDTKRTELSAFEKNGSWAGWRIIYPTQLLEFNIIAPTNYSFSILGYYCLDDTGSINKSESRYMTEPKLHCCSSVLIWKIYYPLREHRYRLKYKLMKENE
jgi:hypothetical protein